MNRSDLEKAVLDVSLSSFNRVNDIISNLIPKIYNGNLVVVDEYTLDESIYRDPLKTIISTPSIFKDYYKNKYKRTYSMSMEDAIMNRYTEPFILFINNLFVKWSDISIIHDFNRDYIILNNVYGIDLDIKLVYLNNRVLYSESGMTSKMSEENIMFSFDENGKFNFTNPTTILCSADPDLKIVNLYNKTIADGELTEKLNMDIYDYALGPDNFFIFNDGKLSIGEVYLTISLDTLETYGSGDMIANAKGFYRESCNNTKFISMSIVNNKDYIMELRASGHDVRGLFSMTEYNPTKDNTWEDNFRNMITNIFEVNPLFLRDAYSSSVRYETYTGAEMKKIIGGETGVFYGTIKVLGQEYMSQALVFINGLCATNYIKHYLNKFEYTFMNLNDDDMIEIMYFENINNNAFAVTAPITSTAIPVNELAIFSKELPNPEFPDMEPSDYTIFPIDFTVDENNNVILPEFYNGKEVVIASKDRYAYKFMDIKEETVSFELGADFALCPDIRRYIVFINGRRIEQDEYFITVMKPSRPFSRVRFYSRYLLNPGDRVAVYYLPAVCDFITDTTGSEITEKGFFKMDKVNLKSPFSRDLYFVFVDGKKVPYTQLKDISSTMMAITESMAINNTNVVAYHYPINEFESYFKDNHSAYDRAIDSFTEDDLCKLFNVYTTISEGEDVFTPNFDRESLINEVIRDNWMAPGVNYGVPITYDYYSDMFGYEDSEGNIIFPTMTAEYEKNIVLVNE